MILTVLAAIAVGLVLAGVVLAPIAAAVRFAPAWSDRHLVRAIGAVAAASWAAFLACLLAG